MKKILFILFSFIVFFGYSQKIYNPLTDTDGKVITDVSGKILMYESEHPNHFEYTPNPEWIPVNNVADNEIWILAFDGAVNKYSAFTVNCVGGYIVDIYGGSNGLTLLSTVTKTSGTEYEFQIPTGTGKYCSGEGYYTYKIVIRSASGSNITLFSVSHHSSTTTTSHPYKIINFGTKNILSIRCMNKGVINPTSTCPYLLYVNTYYCRLINNEYLFAYATSLQKITMAETMDELLYLGETTLGGYYQTLGSFQNCTALTSITLPKSMNSLISIAGYNVNHDGATGTFHGCSALRKIIAPNSFPSLKYLTGICFNAGDVTGSFYNCSALDTIIGIIETPQILSFNTTYTNNYRLSIIPTMTICNANSIPFSSTGLRALTTFNQPILRCSSLVLTGVSNADRSNINYIQIDWANSQFTGNIDIRYNNLSATELDRIFTELPTVVVSRTIYVASNVGSATCDPTIATAKNWVVITS
jgi:hypothetical protein